jgi:hypothetical protein
MNNFEKSLRYAACSISSISTNTEMVSLKEQLEDNVWHMILVHIIRTEYPNTVKPIAVPHHTIPHTCMDAPVQWYTTSPSLTQCQVTPATPATMKGHACHDARSHLSQCKVTSVTLTCIDTLMRPSAICRPILTAPNAPDTTATSAAATSHHTCMDALTRPSAVCRPILCRKGSGMLPLMGNAFALSCCSEMRPPPAASPAAAAAAGASPLLLLLPEFVRLVALAALPAAAAWLGCVCSSALPFREIWMLVVAVRVCSEPLLQGRRSSCCSCSAASCGL